MTRIEKVANIAVIVAAGVLVGTQLYDRFAPRAGTSPPFTSRYMGKAFPLPQSLGGDSEATVLLLVSKRCRYCTESMPFYSRVSSLRSGPNSFRIVAAVPDNEKKEEDIAHFAEHQVALDGLDSMNFGSAGVQSTPTLLLLNRAKIVQGIWTGKLPPDRENEVLLKLKSLCPGCRID